MTSGDIKRLLHRGVQHWASQQATPTWRGRDVHAEWSQSNLDAVEKLAQHILDLPDDDPRFNSVAEVYEGEDWRLREPYPWHSVLDSWLFMLGGTGAGPLSKPDEFVTRWSAAVTAEANEWKRRRPPHS